MRRDEGDKMTFIIHRGLGNDTVTINKVGATGFAVTVNGATLTTGTGTSHFDINLDGGDDSVVITGGTVGFSATIDGGDGNDTVVAFGGDYVTSINAGDGDDSVVLGDTGLFTVDGGDGNDVIAGKTALLDRSSGSILGGGGNDSIALGSNITLAVLAGTGYATVDILDHNNIFSINAADNNHNTAATPTP